MSNNRNHNINDDAGTNFIFQTPYDNVLDNIVSGVSTDWLYSVIYHAESSQEALRDIFNPIDDEIVCGCFLMDLELTYGAPVYEPIDPGQIVMVDSGDGSSLYVVDSLTGAITIDASHAYEKGFLVQEGAVDFDGKVHFGDVNHAYIIGYPGRNEEEIEFVDLLSGMEFPICGFSHMEELEPADEVKKAIIDGNKGTIDRMVAKFPGLINAIYEELQLFKPFIQVMGDEFSNIKGARNAIQDQLRSLKEDLELLMVALAEQDTIDRLADAEGR